MTETTMTALAARFKSGNSIPIDRTFITADEFKQLRAYIHRIQTSHPSYDNAVRIRQLEEQVEQLQAALGEAERDAERYRWLADNRCDVIVCCSSTDYGDGDAAFGPRVEIDPNQFGAEHGSTKAKMDAAIDALAAKGGST